MSGERLSECPECGGALFFTPDGRTQQCERCDYRHNLSISRQGRIIELDKALRFMGIGLRSLVNDDLAGSSSRRAHRDLLAQGIFAVKQKKVEEAFYYLSKVLKADNAHEEERISAWMWMSAVAETNEEKRVCLENVLVINPNHPEARRGLALLEGRLKEAEIIDPEQLDKIEAPQEALPTSVEKMTCPRCDGRMNYKPELQALQCDFCHYRIALGGDGTAENDKKDVLNDEQDFIVALATVKGHRSPVQMRTMQCTSCGIEFILSPETLSLTCPYCNSVYVVETAETQEVVLPQGVIPFTISHEEAERTLRDWFMENKIEGPRVTPIVGAYVPIWTFDISSNFKWSSLFFDGKESVRRVGEYSAFYDDLLVPASEQLPETLTAHFDEFDFQALVAYDARYLADFPAELYQTAVVDASLKARGKAMKMVRKHQNRIAQTPHYFNFQLSGGDGLAVLSYKLVLLPLWITHYIVDGELYDVTINGQNGAIHGTRPQGVVGRIVSWLLG